MHKLFLQFAAISGILAVTLGAFGAHALKERLTESGYLSTFETAVSYQFYHTLALLGIGILAIKYPSSLIQWAGNSMMFGIIVFSGSLLLLCFTGIKWLGAITPLGGVAFIAGWGLLFISVLKTIA